MPETTTPGKSKEQVAVDLVRSRIQTVELELEAMGPEIAQAGLREALQTPQDGDAELIQRHKDLADQLSRLRAAESVALQNEADRLAQKRFEEDKSRARAFAQKSGALSREFEKFCTHIEAAVAAYYRAIDESRQCSALLGPRAQNLAMGRSVLNPRWLSRLAQAEIVRHQRFHGDPEAWWLKTGTLEFQQGSGIQVPSSKIVDQDVENLRATAGKWAMPDPSAPPAPSRTPPAPVEGAVINLSSQPAAPFVPEAERADEAPQPEESAA